MITNHFIVLMHGSMSGQRYTKERRGVVNDVDSSSLVGVLMFIM
ncbi:hypothetical protein DF16_orf00728 [Bacillus thuringiensis serovar kurstaki str. YBT-1520]|nr:hypothetical protein DF16_orf00728 [Bacillus thuringiensis serovar kurstaki str. YBT-1520]